MAGHPRERPIKPVRLPASIAPLVAGRTWARDLVGESGAALYRLHAPDGGGDLYLKHGRGLIADDLTDEMVRLRWLAGRIEVPAIRHFVATADEAWLLMTALPGRTAYQMLEAEPAERPAIVAAIARFLRRLHALPVEQCPFNSDHRLRLAHARQRFDAGLIDTGDFDDERRGWTADQVWATMTALLPFTTDPVVTHGDFSLDNILIADGVVAGCIDIGRVGVADRYQDIAILWSSLGTFGAALQHAFLAEYGIERSDDRKIDFHLLLDECF